MSKLIDRAAKIEMTDDIDVLWASIEETLADAGFEYCVYLSVDKDFTSQVVLHNMPGLYDDWSLREDPFLVHACKSYEVILIGIEFLAEHPYIQDSDYRFIENTSRLGYRSGFAIPTRLHGFERFGGFIVGTGLDREAFLTTKMPGVDEIQMFCMLMHRRLEELHLPEQTRTPDGTRPPLAASDLPPTFDCLAPREKEVIRLLAQGRSRRQTAHICDLSIHTVSDYAKSGYRKLGIHNRAEAAALMTDPQKK